MLSPKRLVEKARKGIFYSIRAETHAASSSHVCTTLAAEKGHFIVYTEDGMRFMVPLALLESRIFQELLKLSEEECGLPGDCPINLPCNAVFMEYILSQLKKRMAKEVEVALLASLAVNRCCASLLSNPRFDQQQFVIS